LWTFVLINMLVQDVHELFRTGQLEEMISGMVNGTRVTEELLLVAGIALEAPIAMIVISLVLTRRVTRWTHTVISVLMVGLIISNGVRDLDDYFFTIMKIIGLAAIVWYSWRWPAPESSQAPLAGAQRA
jgi:divalent metal cation (Fe/Co/Zn/Cd) transporter